MKDWNGFHSSGCLVKWVLRAEIANPNWPVNPEVQWRLLALSRGLGLPIPKPFRAPYIPGITVLIPHYGETILEKKDSLYGGRDDDIAARRKGF